jgi:hypothetical protein
LKGLIAGAALAIAAVIAFQGSDDETAHSQNSGFEQGIERVDSVLQKGLGEETHETIAKHTDSSATWLRGLGAKVQSATE